MVRPERTVTAPASPLATRRTLRERMFHLHALADSAVDFLDIRMALEVARIGRAKTAARHQLIFTATGPLAKPEWSGSRRQRRLQVWLLSGSRFLHPTRAG